MGSTTLSKQIVNGMHLKTNDSSIVKIMKPMALINDNLDELVKMPGRLEQFGTKCRRKTQVCPPPSARCFFGGSYRRRDMLCIRCHFALTFRVGSTDSSPVGGFFKVFKIYIAISTFFSVHPYGI